MSKELEFEKWLASIIKDKGINLSQLARQTNLCYQSIYESLYGKRGCRQLRSSELIAICKYVGVNPMDFADKKEGE